MGYDGVGSVSSGDSTIRFASEDVQFHACQICFRYLAVFWNLLDAAHGKRWMCLNIVRVISVPQWTFHRTTQQDLTISLCAPLDQKSKCLTVLTEQSLCPYGYILLPTGVDVGIVHYHDLTRLMLAVKNRILRRYKRRNTDRNFA